MNIAWGSNTEGQKMVIHNGSDLNPADFTVELGAFQPGFNPTLANAADWEANWKTFDAILNDDTDPSDDFKYDTGGSGVFFVGAAGLDGNQESNSEDATAGEKFSPKPPPFPAVTDQAFVWVYNKTAVEADTEWALYTNLAGNGPVSGDPWIFPYVYALSQPELWYLSTADTAILGTIHGGVGSPDYTGEGYTSGPAANDSVIRTHRLFPMPEPGTWMLFLLGAVPLLHRQRS
ncbi:MAG: hypothetical protein HKO57_11470 [Akkermansiaceae bacterium]|nr:hypothetical protein [Akkermansiaceae bacterium]